MKPLRAAESELGSPPLCCSVAWALCTHVDRHVRSDFQAPWNPKGTGRRVAHDGVDFSAAWGDLVLSSAEGVVLFVGKVGRPCGVRILLGHLVAWRRQVLQDVLRCLGGEREAGRGRASRTRSSDARARWAPASGLTFTWDSAMARRASRRTGCLRRSSRPPGLRRRLLRSCEAIPPGSSPPDSSHLLPRAGRPLATTDKASVGRSQKRKRPRGASTWAS